MDLLSSYDDETVNKEKASNNRSMPSIGTMQSEWDNFEKSLEGSNRHDSSDGLYPEPPKLDPISPLDGATLEKPPADAGVMEEEDESHLPPGVRKKNRCHSSSSSSDSEDDVPKDKKKDHSDSDMSGSDDSMSPDHSKRGEKKEDTKSKERRSSREARHKDKTKKAKRSRSSSGSRSRSRSPHRTRKRSDDHRGKPSRSRSRSRHSRTDRKHGSRRDRSKDRRRSKERDHRRRETRRSRTRSRERRGSYRDRRSSRERSRRSSSRDRRNRSPSPREAKVIKFGDKVIKAGASFGRPPSSSSSSSKPMTFKEKMRQQLIKAIEETGDVAQAFTSIDSTGIVTQTAGTQQVPAAKKPPVPLMANLVSCPTGMNPATVSAAEAAMQSMIALQKETTEKTGVEIPRYYNPAAINPVKYAEQVQKRKLLWSKNKEKEVNSQWHATTLSSDHDDKSKEKFRKLMGIKSEGSGEEGEKPNEELELKQKELFEQLDKEYQYARMATHTHRGVGLGFGSSTFHPPPNS